MSFARAVSFQQVVVLAEVSALCQNAAMLDDFQPMCAYTPCAHTPCNHDPVPCRTAAGVTGSARQRQAITSGIGKQIAGCESGGPGLTCQKHAPSNDGNEKVAGLGNKLK